MQTQALGLRDVAGLLKVPAYRIQYALINGKLPEPRMRLGNNRIFEVQDVQNLAAYFGKPVPAMCHFGESNEKNE